MKRAALARLGLVAAAAGAAHCGGGEPEPVAPKPSPIASATPSASSSGASGAAEAWPASKGPRAKRKTVKDTYHGVVVDDDYQWLEKSDDPEVKAWSDGQSARTRAFLDALPDRKAIHARVKELLSATSADFFALRWTSKTLFALEDQPPKQQAFLVTMKSPDEAGSARTILDPNVLDPKGKTAIDWYVPSHDGKLVAVSLSEGGSENGTLHVYEVATGKERPADVIPRVHGGTAGGSLAWKHDGTGFWYTRYPREGERPKVDLDFFQQVAFHELGKPEKGDRIVLGEGLPRIAEIELSTSEDGKWVHARVANGDGGEFEHWVAAADFKKGNPGLKRYATFADKVSHVELGEDGNLWLLSQKDAPRGKILRLSPATPDLSKAKVVVPESDVVVQRYEITKGRLYVVDLVGGPSQVRVFDLDGKPKGQVPVLPVSQVGQILALEGDDVVFRNQNFTTPPGWYRYDGKTGKTARTGLFMTSPASFDDAESLRDTCVSKDGTKVPVNILRRKGTALDGNNLGLLYGYGGYSVSLSPRFNVLHRVWLDQGGVYALANLRGGGELGEAWHRAGNLTKKQNVFDDFIACAQWLVDQKYTQPKKLAILGASNGGLLMGATLTQRPDLFAAVVSKVGIYDMLRVELTSNGAFNVTEFGTVKDKAQFDALYAYSPYHRVKDGTKYPAVLLTSGANDPRVDPWHSRKLLARLLEANASDRPILLRTSGDTGHGMGTPLGAWIDEEADVYSFLFSQLGHAYGKK